jgi:hypothetical protein
VLAQSLVGVAILCRKNWCGARESFSIVCRQSIRDAGNSLIEAQAVALVSAANRVVPAKWDRKSEAGLADVGSGFGGSDFACSSLRLQPVITATLKIRKPLKLRRISGRFSAKVGGAWQCE